MNKFSYYKGGIKKLTPAADITIERAVELIKGDTYKEDIAKLRAEENPITRDIRKTNLDYFTFSGSFKKRHTDHLIKHSGLICVDLDPYRKSKTKEPELVNPRLIEEFGKVREDLISDKYALCVFTSASGTGYKVVFKTKPEQHLETFRALESRYSKEYNLVLDKGVNDVARACFVSHDPEVFYNPKAELFKIKNTPKKSGGKSTEAATEGDISGASEKDSPEKAKKDLSPRDQMVMNRNLQRAHHVVEQAEAGKVDLTGDYNDWQLIAFSLATFGEPGRELFHRVSAQYSEYDEQKANEKFTDALNKGKFTTPAKFFSLAKDYGLQVQLPKTMNEVKEEETYKQILQDDEQVSDHLKYGIFLKAGTYWSLNDKGKQVEVTNFKMRIIYHVETSDDEAYRLIQIKNIFGLDKVIKMNTDNFVSAGSFKKEIARKGNFIFKGTDSDLCRLQDKLQREEKKTDLIKQLGYNRKFNFYAWANGLFDCHLNKFVPADELGIVEHYRLLDGGEMEQMNFFIPALSKMFADKDDLYVNDKRFVYLESDVKFKDWAALFCKVYGDNGQVALMFYLMAIFSDIVFRVMGDRFPMFNVYGQKGTGKGALIESLMKLFGHGQKQLMLGGASTVVGFMRKSGQFSNALVWLDEYKNNLKTNFIESLKNLYDRIGYERGKKDNTFQTESTRIDSAIIVSGQEMPIIEEALFSRFIMAITKKPEKTEAAMKRFHDLKEMEAEGLSVITVYLLKHRQLVNEKFKDAYRTEQRLLDKLVNNKEVDERFLNNYSALVAMLAVIKDVETVPFNLSEFRELCAKTLLEQFYVLRGSDTIGKWWNVVENLFEQGLISEERHFIVKDSKLYIRIQDIYQFYAEAMTKRKDFSMLDEPTLKNYLENDPRSFVAREKKFFGGAQKWCFVFKYRELGINLIKAADANELKQRMVQMGVYEEDDAVAVEPSPVPVQSALNLKPTYPATSVPQINTDTDDDTPF